MRKWQSQSHVKWYCVYHVVWIPKYRKKVLFGQIRKKVGVIIREVTEQAGVTIIEAKLMVDHVHM